MPLYEPRSYDVQVGKTREIVKLFQHPGFSAMQEAGHDKHLAGFLIADTGNRNEHLPLW